MISFNCCRCKREINEPGGLLHGPPFRVAGYSRELTSKDHLCCLCFYDVLQFLEAPPKWRTTGTKNGHRWGYYKTDKFESCETCGIIRRRDDKNSKCRGPVKITLRKK